MRPYSCTSNTKRIQTLILQKLWWSCSHPCHSDFLQGTFVFTALTSNVMFREDALYGSTKATYLHPGHEGRYKNNIFCLIFWQAMTCKVVNSSNTEEYLKILDGQKEWYTFTWWGELPGIIRAAVLISLHKSKELTRMETQNGQMSNKLISK